MARADARFPLHAGEIGVNPDQPTHQDARHLVDLTTDLGIGLLQSKLLLLCFIVALWTLSEGMIFSLAGVRFGLPGYMAWMALTYSGLASFGQLRVGHPLIASTPNATRARPISFRSGAGQRAHLAIALYGGETDEKEYVNHEFDQVLLMMRRLVTDHAADRVTAGYGWFAIVAPFVVAAPGFFTGDISLGELMVAVGAFNQVQQALR